MTVADALLSLTAIFAFVWLFYRPWQDVCTDYARQLMFERRDALFDMAANGKIEFSSPHYRQIRKAIEDMIRYAHILTLPRFLLFYFDGRARKSGNDSSSVKNIIDSIPDASVRDEVRSLWTETMIVMLAMVGLKSLVFVIIAFVVCIVATCSQGFKFLIRRSTFVRNISETIEAEARSI